MEDIFMEKNKKTKTNGWQFGIPEKVYVVCVWEMDFQNMSAPLLVLDKDIYSHQV